MSLVSAVCFSRHCGIEGPGSASASRSSMRLRPTTAARPLAGGETWFFLAPLSAAAIAHMSCAKFESLPAHASCRAARPLAGSEPTVVFQRAPALPWACGIFGCMRAFIKAAPSQSTVVSSIGARYAARQRAQPGAQADSHRRGTLARCVAVSCAVGYRLASVARKKRSAFREHHHYRSEIPITWRVPQHG